MIEGMNIFAPCTLFVTPSKRLKFSNLKAELSIKQKRENNVEKGKTCLVTYLW
jgi:hypothetical protein